jgi:hypothetical protein
MPVVLLRKKRQLVTLHGILPLLQVPLTQAKEPMPTNVMATDSMTWSSRRQFRQQSVELEAKGPPQHGTDRGTDGNYKNGFQHGAVQWLSS